MLRRRIAAPQLLFRRPLSTMSGSSTPVEDSIRQKVG